MGDVRMSGLLDHLGRPLPTAEISRWGGSFQDYIDATQNLALQPAYTMAGEKQEPVGDSFAAYVQQAYKANGVVYAVSEARRLLLSEAVFKFRHKGEAGGGNDLFDGEPGALAVLETPWPNGTTQDLISRMEQDVTNAGNAFVAMSEDASRVLRRRPDWCEFILTESPLYAVEADVVGIKYTAGGVNSGGPSKLYLIEDVAHWAPTPDPTAEYRGMSWLTPVIKELLADGAATAHKLAFFENAATPNLSVSLKDTVTVEQFRDFMAAMNQSHQGVSNAYKTLYLGGGADVTVVGADMRQLDFRSTQGAGETRIAAAGRVPPIIVGLSEGLSAATYSNYAQARRAFGDSWARPTWRSLCGALSTLVAVPEDAQLWYDDRDIAFLREDRKDAAEILSTNMATINAALAAGWVPDSARDAVLAEDLGQLTHSGLLSVQLQPPPDPNAAPLDPATGLPAADPLLDPATEEDPAAAEDPEAARAATIERRHRATESAHHGGARIFVRDGDGKFAETPGTSKPSAPTAAAIGAKPRGDGAKADAPSVKSTDAVVTDIVEGYGNRYGQWVRVSEIAEKAGLTKEDLKPALEELMDDPDFRAEPEPSRHRITAEDRKYAPVIGGEARHLIRWDDSESAAPSRAPGAGLPSTVNSAEVTVGGARTRVEALPGDRVHFDVGGSMVDLDRATAIKAGKELDGVGAGSKTFAGADGAPGIKVTFHDGHDDGPTRTSVTLLGDDKTVELSAIDQTRLRKALEGVAASRRVDLKSGPVDFYVKDGKVGLRTQVGDGNPTALEFDRKSWVRLMDAHNTVNEGFDEDLDIDVTELTVKTNAGRIRVSRTETADPDHPLLNLSAVDDSGWSLTHESDDRDPFFQTKRNIDEAMGLEV
jgi:phage portal protein BeeE